MKKILAVLLFLFLLLTACSSVNDKPRGEYDESKEWNDYVLQMVIKEAENYIKVAENEGDTDGKASEYYYEKAMEHVPKGFNDDSGNSVSDLITITTCIIDENLEMTKIEVDRIKYAYSIND